MDRIGGTCAGAFASDLRARPSAALLTNPIRLAGLLFSLRRLTPFLMRSRLAAVFLAFILPALAAQPAPFELRDGDRVVLIGDGIAEGEQHHGWIELMLTTRFPDRAVTFRNLGWSGDTPAGDSRFGLSLLQAGREPAEEGWNQLVRQIEETKPTVVLAAYGMASSFDGEADRKSVV